MNNNILPLCQIGVGEKIFAAKLLKFFSWILFSKFNLHANMGKAEKPEKFSETCFARDDPKKNNNIFGGIEIHSEGVGEKSIPF
jgi:hypothetical protein